MNIQPMGSAAVTSTTASSPTTHTSSSSGSKVSAYLQTLHEKFPSINFGLGTTSDGDRYNVAISPKFLEKMAADPELAAKYDQFFADMPAAEENFRSKVQAFGAEVVSSGVAIDEEGNISSWAITRTSSAGSDSAKKTDKAKRLEEQQTAERAAAEKRLQERLATAQEKPVYERSEYSGMFEQLLAQRRLHSSFSAQA